MAPRAESGPPERKKRNRLDLFFCDLGPGLVTGCADDDPSGISTYAVAGAAFGYAPLWTALLSLPLMAAIQLMCGRLGMVSGRGLAAVIRRHYPRWVLWGACLLLIVANVINIAADLGGMGEAAELVTGLPALAWTPAFTVLIVSFLFWSSYRRIARIFKWITLVLLAYVLTAFFAHVDWRAALAATLLPKLAWSKDSLSVLVGILGTTISPYLFFWQAAQEVEEEKAAGKTLAQRRGATQAELRRLRVDVFTGMFVSNLIMYFIILTTAATLHVDGKTQITTAREAAEALRPLAGAAAFWLFAGGLIGTGMLGVPVLAGSCAYAIAEAGAWRGSLEHRPQRARKFYAVLALSMTGGLVIEFLRLNAVKMMFWSAVVNGALAPPLILLVILLTNNRNIMGARVNPPLLRVFGWTTFALMSAATLAMLLFAFSGQG
ncbi:MAG: Nramp family divalent metal transporter [Bryobacterales bacterium]|nr:Nramp family divalent metal transporter [Bryobacterales bacterium]MBV9400378.1 Nramp family divalent metal transporter [Bryobacterales bacterium]